MMLSKLLTTFVVTVALVGTASAAPQDKKAAPAKTSDTATKKAAPTDTTKAAPAKAGALTKADLPKAVVDAVMTAHPNATIRSAVRQSRGTGVAYSVRGVANGAAFTMVVNEDGSTVAAKGKASTPAAKAKAKGKN